MPTKKSKNRAAEPQTFNAPEGFLITSAKVIPAPPAEPIIAHVRANDPEQRESRGRTVKVHVTHYVEEIASPFASTECVEAQKTPTLKPLSKAEVRRALNQARKCSDTTRQR